VTTLTERIPLDDISSQARAVRPGRTVLTVIAAVLFGVGWVTARVFAVVWLSVMWSGVAVREGWRSSHGPSRKTTVAAQAAEIEELQVRLSRFAG
jgi:hypothetical protein